ncbi:MAG: NHL repeat-containing protein, partial [Chloroflexota bacterium]
MTWLFLGLVSLPFAAVLYVLTQRLAPRLLELVPEPSSPLVEQNLAGPTRPRLSSRQLTALRAAAAVLVLALVAVGVSRWPQATPNPKAVAPAAEVQLPPPIALKVQTRFGADGSSPAQFHDPRDVAVDPAGNVYVADTGNKRILKFKPDGSPAGTWTGAFTEPSSLAVVKDGLIVDDSETGHLHKFDFDGKPVPGFEHDLGLSHPRGIAAGPDGAIYAGDTANNRILKVAPDGAPLGAFDTKGAKR